MEAFLIDFEITANISIANTGYLWSWSRVNVLIKDIKDIRSSWCD